MANLGEMRKALRARIEDQAPGTFDKFILTDQEPDIVVQAFLEAGQRAVQIRYIRGSPVGSTGIGHVPQFDERFDINLIASLAFDSGAQDRAEGRNLETLALDTLADDLRAALQADGFNAAINTSLSTTVTTAMVGELSSIEDNISMNFAGYTLPVIIRQTVI